MSFQEFEEKFPKESNIIEQMTQYKIDNKNSEEPVSTVW
jgi:hypothetical protein